MLANHGDSKNYISFEKYGNTGSKITISDLKTAMQHTTRLHELQMWCIDSMASRQQEREKQIDVEKSEKLQ